MSRYRASQLTLWGFSVTYCAIMGILVAVNAPAAAPFWTPLGIVLGAIAFAGLVATLAGRLVKVEDEKGG
jgi:hypothetical protein